MNLTTLIDVVIGLSLVYLGASLWVTILNEYVSQIFRLRARQLGADLRLLIDGKDGQAVLMANPSFAPFFKAGAEIGTYVDTLVLAQQLIGGLHASGHANDHMAQIIKSISAMSASNLKLQLMALAHVSSGSVSEFIKSVQVWAEQSLTMMGEGYKKRTQRNSFFIGLTLAGLFNLDTIGAANHLYRDKQARDVVAAIGTNFVKMTSANALETCRSLNTDERETAPKCRDVKTLLDGLHHGDATLNAMPIGWPVENVGTVPPAFTTLPGWILTALAISLGASFWFDLLTRIVNIRHGMRRPESGDEDEKTNV